MARLQEKNTETILILFLQILLKPVTLSHLFSLTPIQTVVVGISYVLFTRKILQRRQT